MTAHTASSPTPPAAAPTLVAPDPRMFVAYYRVSTQRQGRSGLGLEAQQSIVRKFLAGQPPGSMLLGEYTEIQSGTARQLEQRVELRAALEHAKRTGATLVVAKLDRLARDAAFVLGLKQAGVEFVACDFPEANRLVVTILAATAEYEAHLCSERTKAALGAAKRRGVKLGGFRGVVPPDEHLARMRAIKAERTEAMRKRLGPIVRAAHMLNNGHLTDTAEQLNMARTPTPTGKGKWYPMTVKRFIEVTGADL